uniref:Lipase domain-containing protein n=1 Tax=Arion vulgaris TaxID=1028688 RepID=A0A0B7A5A2_9EUPU
MVLQSVAAGLLVILVVELTLPGSCSGWLVSSRRTKCYEQPPIGCFPTTYPYNNTGRRAPQRPSVVNVQFFFFNSGVSSTMFNYDNADQVLANTYNSSAKTVVIIHGYLENSDRPWIRQLGTELLQKDSHMNVVVVSWVGGSRNLIYFQSAANARVAGAVIALLLEKLVVLGGDRSKFHVIGFSLGAHVAGYVGSRLRGIGRITGLDPARLGFERTPPEARLDPTDAIFVDVIHTDASPIVGLGTFQSLGTVDFYPNGGVNQPGCSVDIINTVSAMMSSFDFSMDSVRAAVACSHLRVTSLFTASVNHNCSYTTLRCSNNFPRGSCSPCESGACPLMGYNIDSTRGIQTAGLYRTVTTSTSPYC